MKTLIICITIAASILGASLIVRNTIISGRPLNAVITYDTPKISKEDLKNAVEKSFAEVSTERRIKDVKVTEVRANYNDTEFRVYYTATFIDGRKRMETMNFKIDDFGVWYSGGKAVQDFAPGDTWSDLRVEVREKQ